MFVLIIFGDKSNIFEDMNNCPPYTDLVSKMVRDYGFLFGVYEVKLSEFRERVYFVRTTDSRKTKGGDSYRIFFIVCIWRK